MEKNYFVYIITNKNNSVLYIWITNNILRRIFEHKNKLIKWFSERYNLNKLVYYVTFNNPEEAINTEKKLKWWTRIRKDWLINKINPSWKDLYENLN